MTDIDGEHLIVILNIASRAVSCTVAQLHPEQPDKGEQVVAHKVIPCHWHDLTDGFRREVVREAVRLAEDSADVDAHSAYVSMSDPNIRSHLSVGWAGLGDEVTITAGDTATALRRCREQATGIDRELLDWMPTTWLLRDQSGEREVADPANMRGHHLTCHSVLVTARTGHKAFLEDLCDGMDLDLEGVIAQPLALYRGISGRLRSRGSSLVIDCGARSTTILVRRREKLVHVEVQPFGGDDLTARIADELSIDLEAAERLKEEIDIGQPAGQGREQEGQLTLFDDLAAQSRQVAAASRICSQEIDRFFKGLADDLRSHGMLAQAGAIHLVGRGALLRGMPHVVREIFDLPVVLGSGDRNREPIAELEGLLTSGLVRIAADRRRASLQDGTNIRRHASGLWNWLSMPLR
jgi:cell division protein FtsA